MSILKPDAYFRDFCFNQQTLVDHQVKPQCLFKNNAFIRNANAFFRLHTITTQHQFASETSRVNGLQEAWAKMPENFNSGSYRISRQGVCLCIKRVHLSSLTIRALTHALLTSPIEKDGMPFTYS